MMVLLDRPPSDIEKAGKELGILFGQLCTPLTRNNNAGLLFGIDNGCYSGFNKTYFLSTLERHKPFRDKCLFVTSPDVVGNARRTLECFNVWKDKLHPWPIALVAQDGLEDLDIPWKEFHAIFIGGSDRFKLSSAVVDICKAAKILDHWVHVGRVNTPHRFDKFNEIADSIDGFRLNRFTDAREILTSLTNYSLFTECEKMQCTTPPPA